MKNWTWNFALKIALIASALGTPFAGAQGNCPKAHSSASQEGSDLLAKLDSEAMRQWYYQTMKNPMPPSASQWVSPTKALNMATLGVLGSIFDLKRKDSSNTVVAEFNPLFQESVRKQTLEVLAASPREPTKELLQMLKEAVHVQDLTATTVIVTASLVSTQFLTGFTQALLHRYQRVGSCVSDFVYRTSGLESEDPFTGATMLDEMVQILKERRGFSFHLVYDKSVWEKEVLILSSRLQAYNEVSTPEEKQRVINLVNQSKDPFLPMTGIVTTDDLYRHGRPVELKRYFQNSYEDPLGFVQIQPRNDFLIRHQMIFQVVQGLPVNTVIEIHAHSEIHLRAYTKLGFELFLKTENPLYPGVDVYVLRGHRESVLNKIKLTIDRSAKGA